MELCSDSMSVLNLSAKHLLTNIFILRAILFLNVILLDGAGPGTTDLPNLVYLGTDSTLYYPAYELKSDYGWS